MFTGLVETIGTVTNLTSLDSTSSGGSGTSLTISDCASILSDASLGDSISVNGTCLTITEFSHPNNPSSSSSSASSYFKVGVSPETLRRTNLGSLAQGSKVNLERSVSASTRMGGHFVQGHVDTIATILGVREDGNSLVFRLQPRERRVLRYVIEKGYVALDGASLTVTRVEDDDDEAWFEIMLIAYTQEKVVTAAKREGEDVNLEIDMVGKYVEKSVRGYFEDTRKGGEAAVLEKMVERIVGEKIKAMDR
ncbi:hypothetical protein EPUS_05936 [Endocarpon pusillum Z07020]|uniref:Riboflavin synthase n=1 Tax=Endocarpon pusillum (strain Z07020 / HMAS-L-300199) TaxID=1263415 RepID=U1GCG2_ENDPU|nr:uncharacterized protein EPUS_05936 [Endocarpon pusillum Z07020]ERF69391.1 hypothetical protein EPUS_05936 [Endocarpon pusillum Z07020]